jgi:hypothetical protein
MRQPSEPNQLSTAGSRKASTRSTRKRPKHWRTSWRRKRSDGRTTSDKATVVRCGSTSDGTGASIRLSSVQNRRGPSTDSRAAYQHRLSRTAPVCASQQSRRANVCNGSIASVRACWPYVRSYPDSDRNSDLRARRLSAKNRQQHYFSLDRNIS